MDEDVAQYLQLLGYVQAVLSVGFQTAVILLQVSAYRRHRHISFAWLSISTLCGIIYLFLALLPQFLHASAHETLLIYGAGFLFFVGQALLGLIGILSLFRAYRALAETIGSAGPV